MNNPPHHLPSTQSNFSSGPAKPPFVHNGFVAEIKFLGSKRNKDPGAAAAEEKRDLAGIVKNIERVEIVTFSVPLSPGLLAAGLLSRQVLNRKIIILF